MKLKDNKTYKALVAKANMNSTSRMPSISSIHALLRELGIVHRFDGETVNVVEFRSEGRTYVNSRHDGKVGKSIEMRYTFDNGKTSEYLGMDSSDSYYSWNSFRYANKLLDILKNIKNVKSNGGASYENKFNSPSN
jgi:hypothetical protein